MKSTRNTFRTIMSIVLCVSMFMSLGIMSASAEDKGGLCCIMEEHQHTTEACMGDKLICGLEGNPGHAHDANCRQLRCEEEHEHQDGCYKLICGMQERGAHVHDSSCYISTVVCNKAEHTHGDSCYYPISETYELTYNYIGEGLTASHKMISIDVKGGSTVTVETGYIAIDGYSFSGWICDESDVVIENGQFTMPEHKVSFHGEFTANPEFNVKYLTQEADGSYIVNSEEIVKAENAAAVISGAKAIDGYAFSKGEDKGDAIELYYDRASYTVTYIVNGEQDGKAETYKFGETVTLRDGGKFGHGFSGWASEQVSVGETFAMPAANVIITGSCSGVDYYVVTYRQNGKGEYPEYSRELMVGEPGEWTKVTAPEVKGYELQSIVQQKISKGVEVGVYYDKVEATYRVITYLETSKNVYGDSAVEVMSGKIGDMTKAVANEIANYVLTRSVEQKEIAADDSTVIELYYDRTTPFPAAVSTTLRNDNSTIITTNAGEEVAAEAEAVEVNVEIVDTVEIPDEETPLASGMEQQQGGFHFWYILLGLVIVAGAWWILLLLKRRKEEEEEATA